MEARQQLWIVRFKEAHYLALHRFCCASQLYFGVQFPCCSLLLVRNDSSCKLHQRSSKNVDGADGLAAKECQIVCHKPRLKHTISVPGHCDFLLLLPMNSTDRVKLTIEDLRKLQKVADSYDIHQARHGGNIRDMSVRNLNI